MNHIIIKILLILGMSGLAMAGPLSINTTEKEQLSEALAQIYDINGKSVITKLQGSEDYGKWETKDYIYIYKIVAKGSAGAGIFIFTKIKNPNCGLSKIEKVELKVGSSLVLDGTLPEGLERIVYSGTPSGASKLLSMSPSNIQAESTNVTFILHGENLKDVTGVYIPGLEGLKFRLLDSTQLRIFGTKINGGNETYSVPFGARDVLVKFKNGSSLTLPNGLSVEENQKANLESDAYTTRNTSWINGFAPYRFYENSNKSTKNGSAKGNCTWYAQGRVIELGYNQSIANKFAGNAKIWDTTAINNNVSMNNTPQVGSIAQRNRGDYGHVAIVEELLGNSQIRISESSYCPGCRYDDYEYKEEVVNIGDFDNYIHLTK